MNKYPKGINAIIKKMLIKILAFEMFSLVFSPEINNIKLIPQIKIPRKMESDVKMPRPFSGEIVEMNITVIIKIASNAIMMATLICFILN
jgi:hypothetical protein